LFHADKKIPPIDELSTEILAEEFEYIASTAGQANEDRARVASFYLVAVGSLVAALFSTQLLDANSNIKTSACCSAACFSFSPFSGIDRIPAGPSARRMVRIR